MAGKAPGTEVATQSAPEYPIAAADAVDILDSLVENVGTGLSVFDLDRVKMPSGGGLAWEVPTLDGKPRVEQEIDGIIVGWKDPRAYWSKSLDETGGNAPPDCASSDGEIGVGTPGGACRTCPMAAFGSAPPKKEGEPNGPGQACKQMRSLFFVQPGQSIPTAMFMPPTSLKPMKQYFLRLTSQGLRYSDVITRLGLDKTKNAAGIDYSFVVPTMVRALTHDERALVRAYSEAIKQVISTVTLQASDVTQASGGLDDHQ